MRAWESRSGYMVVEQEGSIAILRLDRPDKLNAISIPMLQDIAAALAWLGEGRDAQAVVLTGTGRAFSAGDDLPATESLTRKDFDGLLSSFQELTRAVLRSEVPVLAALNGIAVGGPPSSLSRATLASVIRAPTISFPRTTSV